FAFRHGHDEAVGITAAGGPLFDDRLEAAVDHALAVERHGGELLLDRRVVHHLLIGGVAHLPARIFEPREDDFFLRLGVDCLAEVGDLAVGHVAVPSLDLPANAKSEEDGSSLAGVLAISLLVRLWHGRDESFEIGHAAAPSGWGWFSA